MSRRSRWGLDLKYLMALIETMVVIVIIWCMWCRRADGLTWLELFIMLYKDYGRYIDIYKAVRKAWNQIELFMQTYCPGIYNSLNGKSLGHIPYTTHKLLRHIQYTMIYNQ